MGQKAQSGAKKERRKQKPTITHADIAEAIRSFVLDGGRIVTLRTEQNPPRRTAEITSLRRLGPYEDINAETSLQISV